MSQTGKEGLKLDTSQAQIVHTSTYCHASQE